MSIFEKTLKLVLATLLSILLAEFLGLSFATSAGIIAILSVLDTRRSSFKMVRQRFFSAILALMIAAVVFSIFGFSLWVFGLYLILYLPLAYHYNLAAGIAPSTVLVTHLLAQEEVTWSLLANELALFIIGAGFALMVNSYMTSHNSEVENYHEQVEQGLKDILLRFSHFLAQGDMHSDLRLIAHMDDLLNQALALVYRDRHNQIFHQTNYQVHYFEMRKQQNKILRQMAQNINFCQFEGEERLLLAQLFSETASQLSRQNSAYDLLEKIAQALADFRQSALPKTRQEFETRARLFQLLHDLTNFIQLKVDFYESYYE